MVQKGLFSVAGKEKGKYTKKSLILDIVVLVIYTIIFLVAAKFWGEIVPHEFIEKAKTMFFQ